MASECDYSHFSLCCRSIPDCSCPGCSADPESRRTGNQRAAGAVHICCSFLTTSRRYPRAVLQLPAIFFVGLPQLLRVNTKHAVSEQQPWQACDQTFRCVSNALLVHPPAQTQPAGPRVCAGYHHPPCWAAVCPAEHTGQWCLSRQSMCSRGELSSTSASLCGTHFQKPNRHVATGRIQPSIGLWPSLPTAHPNSCAVDSSVCAARLTLSIACHQPPHARLASSSLRCCVSATCHPCCLPSLAMQNSRAWSSLMPKSHGPT